MGLRTIAMGLGLAALVSLRASPASADDGDRVAEDESKPALALAAGGAVTMLALGAGATIIARADDRAVRNAGLIGGQSAMVFAPLVAHAVVGETRRGAWFSLPLLVPVAMQAVVVGFYPGVLKRAPAPVQWTTYSSIALSVFGSLLGVLDAARVGERKPKKTAAPSLAIVPFLGHGSAGAVLSGSL